MLYVHHTYWKCKKQEFICTEKEVVRMFISRSTKNIEKDIRQLEQDIETSQKEIKQLHAKIGNTGLNIDHLRSGLADEQMQYDEAKQMVNDCNKQIEEDRFKIDNLKIKLNTEMTGEYEYIRPCNKTRHPSETTLC